MSIPPKDFMSTAFAQNYNYVCSRKDFKSFACNDLRRTKKVRNLSKMANKTPIEPDRFKEIAEKL